MWGGPSSEVGKDDKAGWAKAPSQVPAQHPSDSQSRREEKGEALGKTTGERNDEPDAAKASSFRGRSQKTKGGGKKRGKGLGTLYVSRCPEISS